MRARARARARPLFRRSCELSSRAHRSAYAHPRPPVRPTARPLYLGLNQRIFSVSHRAPAPCLARPRLRARTQAALISAPGGRVLPRRPRPRHPAPTRHAARRNSSARGTLRASCAPPRRPPCGLKSAVRRPALAGRSPQRALESATWHTTSRTISPDAPTPLLRLLARSRLYRAFSLLSCAGGPRRRGGRACGRWERVSRERCAFTPYAANIGALT